MKPKTSPEMPPMAGAPPWWSTAHGKLSSSQLSGERRKLNTSQCPDKRPDCAGELVILAFKVRHRFIPETLRKKMQHFIS